MICIFVYKKNPTARRSWTHVLSLLGDYTQLNHSSFASAVLLILCTTNALK